MKQLTAWQQSTKTGIAWASSVRIATQWLPRPDMAEPSYLYTDATLTYDSAVRTYDFLSAPPANQLDELTPTKWSAA